MTKMNGFGVSVSTYKILQESNEFALGIHSLASLTFLFLIILGIRNKFKIK